jgi:hypothetical protein
MHSVEDLIDFTITEIQDPIDLIPETPVNNVSELDDVYEEEEFKSESKGMEGNNDHNEESGKPPLNSQP